MSKRRKRHNQRLQAKYDLFEQSEHIPEDDRFVLKEEAGFPLERGGIYSEMGADLTYEELNSFPSTGKEFTHYEQHREIYSSRITEIIGIILVIIGLFIVVTSPFWFSAITLGITLIAHRYRVRVTMYTALTFTLIGFIFAIYSLM